jgi:hypothetical protein
MSRLLAKITLICAGVVGVVLGAHGLYIYCYFRVSGFLGTLITDAAMTSSSLSTQEYLSRLFLAWDVPDQFRDWVLWVTVRGVESLFVPAVLIVAGFVLLRVQKLA